jgi:hypothetical protein
MKNLLFTLFTIGLAGIAAIAATTAMLNAPVPGVSARVQNIGPPAQDKKPEGATPPTLPAPSGDRPAPTPIPDADKPATPPTGDTRKPAEPPAAEADKEEPKEDEDPYEGIAPEDLPPDLQYDADSSVSFPTNT